MNASIDAQPRVVRFPRHSREDAPSLQTTRSSILGARFEGPLANLYWSKQTWLVWNSDIAVVYVSLSDNRQSQTQAQALQVTQVFDLSVIALVLKITS